MRLVKGVWVVLAIAALVVAGSLFLTACGEDEADITRPTVQYNDQTFALLVCDGNGNSSNPWGWAHDGAEVCTLDWNNDGSGPNRLPVVYVYNRYPVIDGAVTAGDAETQGDKDIWAQAPWATIPTHAVFGGGSGITEVKAKAVFTYVNPPRIWFLFQWKDTSHTIRGNPDDGPDTAGTLHYHWYCAPGFTPVSDGFNNNRQWNSREDWLGLVFSTWHVYNKNNGKKFWSTKRRLPDGRYVDAEGHWEELNWQYHWNHWADHDPNWDGWEAIQPADTNTNDWQLIESIPGFQTGGLNALIKAGEATKVYQTRANSNFSYAWTQPYGDFLYNGPYADFWFMSASRANYTAAGAWDATEGAYALDCYINTAGFNIPNSVNPPNVLSLEDTLTVDDGITGYIPNGGFVLYPGYQAPADPGDNPPGATYMWNASGAAEGFNAVATWKEKAVISGYLHRPSLGSAGDIRCRFSWWDKDEPNYEPYDGKPGTGTDPNIKFPNRPHNLIAKEGYYTLEVEREIGTLSKNKPTEDVLLGIFNPHPGE